MSDINTLSFELNRLHYKLEEEEKKENEVNWSEICGEASDKLRSMQKQLEKKDQEIEKLNRIIEELRWDTSNKS